MAALTTSDLRGVGATSRISRHSWRCDMKIIKITVSASSDGAARSINLSIRAWRIERSFVASLSLTMMRV
jgi:hypothetical protein